MRTSLLCLALTCSLAASAQSAEPKPLTAMPYSPSLNLTSLDKSVDPCVDFYQFSCGGWQKNNPIPADQAGWSVYGKLANDNMQFLWGILDEDSKLKTRTAVQQKVGDFYGACMDVKAIDALGVKPIEPLMAKIDALKTSKDVYALLPELHHAFPGSYFFASGTGQDAADSTVMIAEIVTSGLGLPDRDYYLKTDPKSVELRKKYVAYMAQSLTMSGVPAPQAESDAAAILALETEMAKPQLTRVERRDPHNTYHKLTLAELKKLMPGEDWEAYFAGQDAKGVASLNVAQPVYMKALANLLDTTPLPVLKAYLRFHLVTAASANLSEPFRTAQFEFYSHTLRGVPAMPPRWKTCVRMTDRMLGEALGQEFVKRTFSADMKAKTLLMTKQIEDVMRSEIEHLDWMSDPTKQEALRKLSAIRNKVGYPDNWRDYTALTVKPNDFFGNVLRASEFEDAHEWHKLGKPVDLNEWDMTPPTVNAYFNSQMNDINFPAGVLQPPLYDAKMDDAPNYGNTGSTIGHELTHAFDDEGRQFDAKGNLHDWWTPADAKGFEDRINCIRDQFATYTIVDDIKINSKLTSGEDVADVAGTLLAYIAWRKQTETMHLAPIDGYTPDQRFFIGLAQWACENQRPENLRVSAVTNPHSPGFARINGVVSNLPEFATAFGCKKGQPMVHEPTCKVW